MRLCIFTCRLIAILFFSFLLVAEKSSAQSTPPIKIELPVSQPIVLLSPDGKIVVCAQWVRPKPVPDEGMPSRSIRLLVVDLDKKEIVATRDFEDHEMRFALSNTELYLADNQTKKIHALSLKDLTEVRQTTMTQPVTELLIVADTLLCSTGGDVRHNIEDLSPSKKWASLRRGDFVKPVEGGWYLDGVVYDRSLQRVRMVAESPFTTSNGFDWYRYWGRQISGLTHKGFHTSSHVVNHTYPFAVHALASSNPIRNPRTGESIYEIRLAIEHLGQNVIADVPAGNLASAGLKGSEAFGAIDRHPLVPARIATPPGNYQRPYWTEFAWFELCLASVGNRVVAAIDGHLIVWDLDEAVVRDLKGPVRFSLEQTAFVEFDSKVTIKNVLIDESQSAQSTEPSASTRVQDEFSFSPRARAEEHGLDRLIGRLNEFDVKSEEELVNAIERNSPFFERIVGRPLKGVLHARRFAFTTNASEPQAPTNSFGYYLLSEIPKVDYEPVYEKRWQKMERERAHAAERSRVAALEASARVEQRKMEVERQQWAAWRKRMEPGFQALIGGFIISLPISWIVGSVLFQLLEKMQSGRKYFGVLSALVGIIAVLLVGFVLIQLEVAGRKKMGPEVSIILAAAGMFFMEMLIVGCADLAWIKGYRYPALIGVVVGLFLGPLGLLIMVLLPDQRSAPQEDDIWTVKKKLEPR